MIKGKATVRFVPDCSASDASIGSNNQQRVSTDEANEEWMVLAVVALLRAQQADERRRRGHVLAGHGLHARTDREDPL